MVDLGFSNESAIGGSLVGARTTHAWPLCQYMYLRLAEPYPESECARGQDVVAFVKWILLNQQAPPCHTPIVDSPPTALACSPP